MSDKIFESHAPQYWGKGFSALPVKPGTKGTKLPAWTEYCQILPKDEMQAELLKRHPGHGIGLALGRLFQDGSQLGFVDVDANSIRRFVEAFVGITPCARIGKKGIALAVRLDASIKSHPIAFAGGGGAIDILGNKRMVVLPPTIHPETQKPYLWVGSPLLEIDPLECPLLTSARCFLLGKIISHKELPQILTGQSTNDATLNLTASMVGLGMGKEEILRLVPLLFPLDYEGNTLGQLEGMIDGAITKGFEPAAKTKEGKLPPQEQLILWGEQHHLYLDPTNNAYISLRKGS
ncbi:MAG: hypothetical protein EOP52_13855 [Sphingobacteriales bacterium]|nr:MAG: hypothetical protein EOP52_13855 [Sphingobacteriales bacterium]